MIASNTKQTINYFENQAESLNSGETATNHIENKDVMIDRILILSNDKLKGKSNSKN